MRTMSRQAAFSYLARQHPQQGPAVGSRATSAMTHPQPLGCAMHPRKHAWAGWTAVCSGKGPLASSAASRAGRPNESLPAMLRR